MTRGNAVLMSISGILGTMAIAVAPASGYESVNSITGERATSPQTSDESGHASINATLGGGSQSVSQPQVGGSEYASLNAVLAESPKSGGGSPEPVSNDYRSLNSILAGAPPVELPSAGAVEVRKSGGFDWGDALIGALTGFGLALMAFALGRTLSRHRPATVKARA